MAIQRKPVEEPRSRSLTKGFTRLAFDLWADKIPVKVALINGNLHAGMIVNFESDTMALEVPVDRFNIEVVYIPMSSVVSITAGNRTVEK